MKNNNVRGKKSSIIRKKTGTNTKIQTKLRKEDEKNKGRIRERKFVGNLKESGEINGVYILM